MRRLRLGERVVLIGIGCLVASMFLPWYSSPAGNLSLWETFGPGAALILATLCAGLAVVVSALAERGENPSLAVATAVWCVLIGLAGTIAAIVRLLERPDSAGSTCAGPWLGLAGAARSCSEPGWCCATNGPRSTTAANPEPRPRP